MEQRPRRAGGMWRRMCGQRLSGEDQYNGYAPTHRHHQEETLKSRAKFGILGAFIALAAALGVVGSSQFAAPADAQIPLGIAVTKTGCPANVALNASVQCTITITNQTGAALVVPEPIVFRAASGNAAGYGAVQLLNGVSGATGADVDTALVVNPNTGATQSIVVSCFTVGGCTLAPGAAGAITIAAGELGVIGGPIVESIQFGGNVAVNLTGGLNTVGASAITGTVNCGATALPSGNGTVRACTLDVNDTDLFPNTIASGTFTITMNAPAGVVFQSTGTTTATFNCTGVNTPQSCDNLTFNIVTNTANVAGPVTFTVQYSSDIPAVDSNNVFTTPVVLQVVTGSAITTFTKSFAPASIAVGGTSTLTFTISNPAGTAGGVTGIAFTDNLPAGLQVAATPALTNTCGGTVGAAAGAAAVTLTGGTITTAGGTCTITVAVTATTPGPKVNTTGAITSTQGGTGGTATATLDISNIATFRQPTGFIFTCTTGVAGPFTGPVPGQIGSINVLAVGELPSGLQCQVQLAANNAAGVLTAGSFAPGTIEVSSLGAGLQSAVGTLGTNLRIGCDTLAQVNLINPLIDPNTCQGVTFRVFGFGVGFVEIRVRYEPLAVAAQAGIIEIEGSFNVAFVAPVVTVSLALSPNPVTVGSFSTATARFNRTINCQQAFGTAAAPLACIDPTTGLPIIFNLGSALNGSVVFNVDNTAIASFQDVTAAPPSPQTAGFVTTANQVVRRCGFFPTAGLPANPITGVPGFAGSLIGGPLNGFFGGCETATASLRGNAPGVANVSATFIPDMPGAFGSSLVGLGTQISGLLGFFGNAVNPTSARVLEVVGPAASGSVQLARGCNNVSPTVTETAAAYGARVTPQAALVAIWEHQAATNTFRGFSPLPGAPNDLAGVTRLRPVFVCVSAAATLDQPPA